MNYPGKLTERAFSCGQDYSPCSCVADNVYGLYVTCLDVDPEEVKQVFARPTTKQEIYSFIFRTSQEIPGGIRIPDNLLSGKQAVNLIFESYIPDSKTRLIFDRQAFTSTSNVTTTLYLMEYDLIESDFSFLSGFNYLSEIWAFSANAQSLSTLPPLRALKSLIINSKNFGLIGDNFPNLSPAQLEILDLVDSSLDDTELDRVLRVLVSTPSTVNSLAEFRIDSSRLTRIPDLIKSFHNLDRLGLRSVQMTSLKYGSLNFSNVATVKLLDFSFSTLQTIEPGAFLGKSIIF